MNEVNARPAPQGERERGSLRRAVIESVLTQALRTSEQRPHRVSQTEACQAVLAAHGGPLHVTALLEALTQRNRPSTRGSLVSALHKKLTPHGPFQRTSPNTFGLAAPDAGQELSCC